MAVAGRLRTVALGLAVVGIGACADPVAVRSGLGGTYDYEARDLSGSKVVSGTITIAVAEDSTVTGEWSFSANVTEVGPQDGNGTLEGVLLPEGFLSINLNPTSVDNNVFLQWNQSDGSVDAGTWTWTTFRGPTNEGTFRAEFK